MTDTVALQAPRHFGRSLTLRAIAFIGLALFGLGLALTFVSPIHYEKAARGFLESRVEEEVRNRLDFVAGGDAAEAGQGEGQGRLARFARSIAERNETRIAALRERLTNGLNEKVAATIARMQDLSCECRAAMVRSLDAATALDITALERAEPQLRRIIEGRYGEIVRGLLQDLRIFTGANLAAFALLLGLSFAKPGQIRQLFVPGLLLAASTLIASAIYIFGQNWFFTLLYSDYVGLGYLVWLTLIYGFLIDIAVFRARVTTRLVEYILSSIPNMLTAGPC